MTSEQTILERLAKLERLLVETRLPDDQIVGAEYVAELFNCSTDAVMRGRFGTDEILRVRHSPLGFNKGSVHKVLKNLSKTAKEIAVEERAKARPVNRKKKSILEKVK